MGLIYKYLDFSTKNTLKIISESALFFSEPKNFNDPFDSRIELDFNGTLDDWRNYFFSIGRPQEEIESHIKTIKSGAYNPQTFINSENIRSSSVLRINCFSKKSDNILLWAHYAKNHSGICIGFNVYEEYNSNCFHFTPNDLLQFNPDIPNGIIPLFEVKYQINMPLPYNRLKDHKKRLMEFALTKSILWSYEKEMRAVVLKDIVINNPVHFNIKEIREIIFGVKTTDDNKQLVYEEVNKLPNNGNWIKYFNCTRKEGSYELELIPQ
jgi:hypothetical protein